MRTCSLPILLYAILALTASAPAIGGGAEVRVSEFGARPDDGKNDLKAIRRAIAWAKAHKAEKLIFDAGTYDIFAGDVSKEHAILVEGIDDFQMCGATAADGSPATVLLRHYDMGNNLNARNLLRVSECRNFTLSNVVFDNYPRYMTSGEVVFNDGNVIAMKIFPGCSYVDGTLLYCCNLWDMKTGNLKHCGSVTFGSPVSRAPEKYTTHTSGFPEDRMVFLENPEIASKVEIGDGISWHFGWNGVQVQFWKCDNMTMENVESHSAIGFHFSSDLCRNVYGNRVRICRDGNDLNVGSRDGWKMWLCSGEAVMNDIYMEGVRWDGQNVHGKFVFPIGRQGDNTVVFTYNGMPHERIEPGDKVGMWKDRESEVLFTVKKHEQLPPNDQYKRRCSIEFEEIVPEWVNGNTVVNLYSHVVKYTLQNSYFCNIAGTASLLRNDNSTILNNRFHHIMYPAVGIGGELSNESVTSKDCIVAGCEFVDCGWQPRHGETSAIAIAVDPFKDKVIPYIHNVSIIGNTFRDCSKAIGAKGVEGLVIGGNKFYGVAVKADIKDCRNVKSDIGDND